MQRSAYRFDRGLLQAVLLGALCGATSTVAAQEPVGQAEEPPDPAGGSVEDLSPALAQVNVTPVAHDEEIRTRLQSVFDATGWFTDPRVEVREGVVFLNGPAETVELKKWAGDLARSTQDVVVGIGYDDSINEAQEIARKVLADHPAVLNDPEPSVLADSLGRATINLRVYFWLNGREHSWLKVRSSVIRLVKLAFQQRGISMPDEAREVVFPQGIPVTMLDREPEATHDGGPTKRLPARAPRDQPDVASTQAEGGLSSEAGVIKEQARQVQPLNDGENLLKVPSGTPPADEKAKSHGDSGNEPGK